jgi:hypothetical protein
MSGGATAIAHAGVRIVQEGMRRWSTPGMRTQRFPRVSRSTICWRIAQPESRRAKNRRGTAARSCGRHDPKSNDRFCWPSWNGDIEKRRTSRPVSAHCFSCRRLIIRGLRGPERCSRATGIRASRSEGARGLLTGASSGSKAAIRARQPGAGSLGNRASSSSGMSCPRNSPKDSSSDRSTSPIRS